MEKCILFFAAIWMTLCFCSCDDGRIYEKEVNIQRGGRAMKLTGRFSGSAIGRTIIVSLWQASMIKVNTPL